ncbi:MAG TPA: thermonuclease family protein [Micromonosporaceae bacterium]
MIIVLVVSGLAFVRWRSDRTDNPTATAQPSPHPSAPTSRKGQPSPSRPIPSAPNSARPPGLPDGVPASAQRIKIAFTRDGDTLEANAVAAGKPIPTTDRVIVRLLGIDAPEVHGATGKPQCYSRDAYKELQRLVPNASTAWVVADQQLHDQYQRYLLYVWNSKGVFVNLQLAQGGYARMLSIKPNLARQAVIDKAVADAEAARRGLWGVCVAKPK